MMHLNRSFDVRALAVRLAVTVLIIAAPGLDLIGETAALAPVAPVTSAGSPANDLAGSALDFTSWDAAAIGDLNPTIFSTALDAAAAAVLRGDAVNPGTLTVIDFTRPSTQKRMWVFDLRTRAMIFDEWVSHGRGSGTTMATSFSNVAETNKSSLGLFRTAEAYVGKNGYSLRLDGLDRGVNDRARERAIVIHGAPYVNPAIAKVTGYLGRSLGCPAVRPQIARALIDTVKGGGLLYAYGPASR
jgi:hypothetical protein